MRVERCSRHGWVVSREQTHPPFPRVWQQALLSLLVSICIIFPKKSLQCELYPGASCGHLGVTILLSEAERLCLQMSASLQALPHGSLALTSCHCETAPCEPVHGPACGPCDQGLSQPSRLSVTRRSSPEYNSALLPETLGAIPNSSSDGKCNDFGVCRSGYLAASLYPACPGAQRHGLGVITRQLRCYQALGSSAGLVVVLPFFESACGAQTYGLWLVSVLFIMLLSGIRVVGVDFSIYWISG